MIGHEVRFREGLVTAVPTDDLRELVDRRPRNWLDAPARMRVAHDELVRRDLEAKAQHHNGQPTTKETI